MGVQDLLISLSKARKRNGRILRNMVIGNIMFQALAK